MVFFLSNGRRLSGGSGNVTHAAKNTTCDAALLRVAALMSDGTPWESVLPCQKFCGDNFLNKAKRLPFIGPLIALTYGNVSISSTIKKCIVRSNSVNFSDARAIHAADQVESACRVQP